MKKFWSLLLKPRAWIANILLIGFTVLFFSLGFLNYLQPIKEFLDSETLSFKLGETKFSVYLITKAILTAILLFWATGLFSDFGESRIRAMSGFKESNKTLIAKAFQILVYFVGFIIGMDVLGIDLTALTIFSGAIGIGLGFGLQKITSNFISGIILLFEKSIENGDLVELEGGTYGYIRRTKARYTLIETFDGKEIMIPNESFITNNVTNWTFSSKKGRVDIKIGISYDSDIDKAMDLILEAAKEHPRTIKDPDPACFLSEFADSSINFELYFWVADVTEGRLGPKSDVHRAIWKKFKENNISMPFPQRDVHLVPHKATS